MEPIQDDRQGVTYRDHLWSKDGVCCLCGEQKGRENPAGQWWCWDNTFDFDMEP